VLEQEEPVDIAVAEVERIRSNQRIAADSEQAVVVERLVQIVVAVGFARELQVVAIAEDSRLQAQRPDCIAVVEGVEEDWELKSDLEQAVATYKMQGSRVHLLEDLKLAY